jgi:transcriptional regulator with XRE-family HTH domain
MLTGGGEFMKSYADILRELREDRDLTQSQVARVLGTTQQVYSRYERGVNEMPVHHLRTLCLYYHVSSDYVLGLPKESRWPR